LLRRRCRSAWLGSLGMKPLSELNLMVFGYSRQYAKQVREVQRGLLDDANSALVVEPSTQIMLLPKPLG